MPTKSAHAKSFSVAPPKTSSEPTGSSVMKVVASERRIVSHIETFVMLASEDHRHRELEVEPDRDVEDDEEEREEDREDRVLRDLATEARRHGVDAEAA